MEVIKTVSVPVHYAVTKRKLYTLDRMTARLSYGVLLFSKLIETRDMDVRGYGDFTSEDIIRIKALTKLSSAYMQQCRDQALWIWRSYRKQHEHWKRIICFAKGIWRQELNKREPQRPLCGGLTRKIPVRIDGRTGSVEISRHLRLSAYVLRLSTLKKRSRVVIPLNSASYHSELLRSGRVVDFQLLKRNGWFYAHICVKCNVPDRPVKSIAGIDLGVQRAIATVLLRPGAPLDRQSFSIITDGEKRDRLRRLERRIRDLQRGRKWTVLTSLRNKRRNIARYYDRLDAIRVAKVAEKEASLVAIGYPKSIKYQNYRGNGKPRQRQMLQYHFSYGQRINYIAEECAERGIRAERVLEASTSRRCHRCGSMNSRRPTQSSFWCLDCGLQYNADWNAAINIGSVFLPMALSRRANEGLAYAGDELAYKPTSPEVRKNDCRPAFEQPLKDWSALAAKLHRKRIFACPRESTIHRPCS